jgi:hypothetical protein
VAAPELSSQEGRARSHMTRGGSRAHLYMEVWFKTTAYVAARGCTTWSLSWLRACMQEYSLFRVPIHNIEKYRNFKKVVV